MSIRSLNLDSMFVPTSTTEIEFEMIKFPGGELHIKLNKCIDYNTVEKVVITNRIKDGDDIMKILIAKNALEQYGIKVFDLIIPYIPYARQDRAEIEGESFTLKVFANLINAANFNKVIVFDAHSDVAPALINNCSNVKNHEYVFSCLRNIVYSAYRGGFIAQDKFIKSGEIVLISPDSGANKKINKLQTYIQERVGIESCLLQVVKCDKKRNMSDGTLSGFEVMTENLDGKICVIIDDICSRGGTFMGLTSELKKKNAGDIYLIVSHYENSADEQKLKDAGITKVYKTNSMNDHKSNLIINSILNF